MYNNGQPILLDCQTDVNITFGSQTSKTTKYMKLKAPNQLLLSELF